jgi:hypothetical protein
MTAAVRLAEVGVCMGCALDNSQDCLAMQHPPFAGFLFLC